MGKGCCCNTNTKEQCDHHANENTSSNDAHKATNDNHANHCNCNHSASKEK